MHGKSQTLFGHAFVNEFVAKLAKKIEDDGWNVSELARKSGVARPYIYRILSGQHVPSLEVAYKLADAVGLQVTLSEKTA